MKHPLFTLGIVLLIKAILLVGFISSGVIGLGPDEAQYWTWSQQLDWGYYSKPPGIAWEIAFGAKLFGDTELGVRFGALIIGFLLPLAVYRLARSCDLKKETAFWAGIVMAFSPLGVFSSFLATTDAGMVLFWTLSCAVIADALTKGKPPSYLLLGFLILCGALFKWPIYLLWIAMIPAMVLYPYLYRHSVFGGVILSIFGLFPSVIWNAQHEWATFKHVFYTIMGSHAKEVGTTPLFHGNLLEFLGAQAGLLSPVFFLLLLCAFALLIKQRTRMQPALVFCGGLTLLIVGGYSVAAIFQKMQGNWCVFAYPSGIVFLTWFACEVASWGKVWLKAGTALSVLLCALVGALPYKLSPFKHNVGWNSLLPALHEVDYDPSKQFLFSDKYQMTSILSFYGPGQKRAYFLNLQGVRKNQFSYWPGMTEEQKGQTGLFVVVEAEKVQQYQQQLAPYFDQVEYLGDHALFFSNNKIAKKVIIFKCLNYNGKEPLDSHLF